jgi:hypothetical protein
MKAGLEEMEAAVDVFQETLDKMDTTNLEANHEKSDAVAEHQKVPKDEAAGEIIGALEDRYRDRHLAIGRRRQPKKWTQVDGGSRKKLAAARRRMTRHAVPARRKGSGHKGPAIEKRCRA